MTNTYQRKTFCYTITSTFIYSSFYFYIHLYKSEILTGGKNGELVIAFETVPANVADGNKMGELLDKADDQGFHVDKLHGGSTYYDWEDMAEGKVDIKEFKKRINKKNSINHKVPETKVDGKFVPFPVDKLKNTSSYRTLPLIPAVEAKLLQSNYVQSILSGSLKRMT